MILYIAHHESVRSRFDRFFNFIRARAAYDGDFFYCLSCIRIAHAVRGKCVFDFYRKVVYVRRSGKFSDTAYRKPFAVKAAESMLRSLDTMTSLDGYKELYQVLHNGGLDEIGIGHIHGDDMRCCATILCREGSILCLS